MFKWNEAPYPYSDIDGMRVLDTYYGKISNPSLQTCVINKRNVQYVLYTPWVLIATITHRFLKGIELIGIAHIRLKYTNEVVIMLRNHSNYIHPSQLHPFRI